MLLDPTKATQRTPNRPRKRAVFLTYQRTTFTDALRTAVRLREHGAYEPVFLVSAERASSLEQESNECRHRGIACLLEEEILAADGPLAFDEAGSGPGDAAGRVPGTARGAWVDQALRIARKLAVKLRERAGM